MPFDSPTRFDWAELTVIPSSSDVANLTAVDQFGIGMQLATFNGGGSKLEQIGSANSNTIFGALQQIPGGPAATVRSGGHIIRVLSEQVIRLPAAASVRAVDERRAGDAADRVLRRPVHDQLLQRRLRGRWLDHAGGNHEPPWGGAGQDRVDGSQLINDIYTGGNTPNTAAGAIYRDLLSAFSTGLWGGRYGNDALSFCTNPITNAQGSWCPSGFNQPAFGAARAAPAPYATCEHTRP